MSGAWVLPSLVGPPAAGFVTERLSLHWVFSAWSRWSLRPGCGRAAARRLRPARAAAGRGRVWPPAAAGAAAGVTALGWAAQRPGPLGAGVAAAALAVLVPSLRRLLPAGTFRARPGVPRSWPPAACSRACFSPRNSYVPLMLTATHGWSVTAAGDPAGDRLAALDRVVGLAGPPSRGCPGPASCAPGSACSAAGDRRPAPGRGRLGCAVGGVPSLDPCLARHGPRLLGAVVFRCSATRPPEMSRGARAAAQLADQLTTASVLIGAGGALLALLATPAAALGTLLATPTALAVVGALLASRAG